MTKKQLTMIDLVLLGAVAQLKERVEQRRRFRIELSEHENGIKITLCSGLLPSRTGLMKTKRTKASSTHPALELEQRNRVKNSIHLDANSDAAERVE